MLIERKPLKEFVITDEFLIRTSGTSDGTQDKYYKDGLWFKLDRYGGECFAETVASLLLKESGFAPEFFVEYTPCLINGKNGCYSKDFLNNEENFELLKRTPSAFLGSCRYKLPKFESDPETYKKAKERGEEMADSAVIVADSEVSAAKTSLDIEEKTTNPPVTEYPHTTPTTPTTTPTTTTTTSR